MKTIIYEDIELKITYDYTPEEPRTWDYPGYPAEVIIEDIHHKGESVYHLLGASKMEDIENMILEEIIDK